MRSARSFWKGKRLSSADAAEREADEPIIVELQLQ
jgi:hypothetical protein